MKETKKCDESRQLNIKSGHLQKDRVEPERYAEAPSISMTSKNGQNARSEYPYGLLEKIISNENLNEAFKRVKKNKGSHGIDKMGVDELLPYLKRHGDELKLSIRNGSYKPNPVRRVEIPKDNGKTKGYWRTSNSPILATTLTNKYLSEQGFITLTERYL